MPYTHFKKLFMRNEIDIRTNTNLFIGPIQIPNLFINRLNLEDQIFQENFLKPLLTYNRNQTNGFAEIYNIKIYRKHNTTSENVPTFNIRAKIYTSSCVTISVSVMEDPVLEG